MRHRPAGVQEGGGGWALAVGAAALAALLVLAWALQVVLLIYLIWTT